MATVKPDLITAEQYRAMLPPENGSKVELVRGELETICRRGFRHGLRLIRIGSILDSYGRSGGHGRAVVETGIVTGRSPDTVRGPDTSYCSAQRLPLDRCPKATPIGAASGCGSSFARQSLGCHPPQNG